MAIVTHTTPELVRGVIEVDPGVDLTPSIRAAAMIVNARLVGIGYTDDEIVVLETWLAAHFYQVNNPRLRMEQIGRSQEQIITQSGLGLDLTHPGQQVKVLDYLGGLVALGEKRKRVQVVWAGKTPEQRGYSRGYGYSGYWY